LGFLQANARNDINDEKKIARIAKKEQESILSLRKFTFNACR
jgi:hypothetical protein